MNRYIKNGLIMAIPNLLAIVIVVIPLNVVAYFMNISLGSDGSFFIMWGTLFSIIFLIMALIGFIIGIAEERSKTFHFKEA